jgi:hypothetical protein
MEPGLVTTFSRSTIRKSPGCRARTPTLTPRPRAILHVLKSSSSSRMDEISPALRDAICDVVRVSLSDQGYVKTRHTMWLNGYLGELTGAPAILGEWSYNFTLFGEPSEREPWGWHRPGA